MNELLELIKQFPAIWILPGFFFASAFMYFILRRTMTYSKEATEGWRDMTKEQIKGLTDERESYKSQLHTERDAHQATKLRIVDLESRPDISILFKTSQEFYKAQTDAQANMAKLLAEQTTLIRQTSDSIIKHDEDVEIRMKPVQDSLKIMAEGIKELLSIRRADRPRARRTSK